MKNDRIENEYIMWGRKEVFVQSGGLLAESAEILGRGSPTRLQAYDRTAETGAMTTTERHSVRLS